MLCKETSINFSLPCSLKWVYEIIAFISLIFSLIIVYITVSKIKMNLVNKLIIQIIIAEIIDEINILLGIVSDGIGAFFESYDSRMYVCYSQIYLSVFSCLWALTASLFISIKLYDIILNKSKIFKGNTFMNRNINILSISIPIILSYIIWMIHISKQVKNNTFDSFYIDKLKAGKLNMRLIFCWLNKEMSIALAIIVALLIAGNLYFSIFRGYFFLRRMKKNIIERTDEDNLRVNKKIKSISQIQSILFLYPIISSVIWIIFFLFIFLFYFPYRSVETIGWSVVFCIFMTIRQTIYILVYFLSQKNLRKLTTLFFTCKICKKKKGEIYLGLSPSVDSINE